MINKSIQDYSESLTTLGVENTIVEHPATKDIGVVLSYLGLTFADCSPTLIMKADDYFLAIVIRGDTRANFKKIKKEFGIKDLRMATPEEFVQVTGVQVGTARIYTPNLKTIFDTKIFEKEYLVGGSGKLDCSIRVKTADFHKIPDSITADVSQ